MSTDRETTRVVRSWLEEGVTALPDRVLDTVLDQVPATRQRRAWWPAWRFADMNNTFRLGIAAVAVVVLALTAYSLLPGHGPAAGGRASSPASLDATAGPTVAARPSGSEPVATLLPAGTYHFTTNTTAPYSVTVPQGWTLDADNFLVKGGSWPNVQGMFTSWTISHVYGDICHWRGTLRPAGTAAALRDALTAQTGHTTTTGPTTVTLGGLRVQRITIFLSGAYDTTTCDGGVIRLWPDAGPDENGGLRIYPEYETDVYVVNDTTVIVAVKYTGLRTNSVLDELDAIVGSVRFDH